MCLLCRGIFRVVYVTISGPLTYNEENNVSCPLTVFLATISKNEFFFLINQEETSCIIPLKLLVSLVVVLAVFSGP